MYKTDFKDLQTQATYISKFYLRHISTDKICQFCNSNKAKIINNAKDPYKIQLVCDACRKENYFSKTKMYEGIPLIDLTKLVEDLDTIYKVNGLTKEMIKIVESALTYKGHKQDFLKEHNLGYNLFNKIIADYEALKNVKVKDVIYARFQSNRLKVARASKIKTTTKSNNNIYYFKSLRFLSNEDIIEKVKVKYNKTMSMATISNICTNKVKPTMKTMCILADILDASIYELFPSEETLILRNVKIYDDYIKLSENLSKQVNTYCEEHNISLREFCTIANISYRPFIAYCNTDNVFTLDIMNGINNFLIGR